MTVMFSRYRLVLLCLLGLTGSVQVQAQVVLVPYYARYTLQLRHDASSSSDGVAALKGHLEVRVEQSCDGWDTQQSLGFRLLGEDGSDFEHLAYLRSFEENDAGGFTFSSQTWEDRQSVEQIAGVVRRDARDGSAMLRYSKPAAAQERLPAQTLFPGEHARQVLAAARAGKRVLMHTVFDGSSIDNPFQISSWIGKPRAARAGDVGALAQYSSWPVRLAYYAVNTTEPLPQFEMGVVLYENGVAGDMIYDYGDFEVDVILQEVTLLAAAKCP